MPRVLLAFLLFAASLPATAQDKPLTRIAFGSCADQDKPCPIWGAIGKLQPELLVLLGDTIYADLDKSKAVTSALIQSKYDILNALPAFAALRKSTPMMAVWDDHDYGKNDGDARFPLKDQSRQIFLDFLAVPKDSPRRTRKGVYDAQVFGPPGKRVQVILLDGRYHRSTIKTKFDPRRRLTESIPTDDPAATFLGEEQWKWLEEQLNVPAEVRLLGSGIQLLCDEHPFEKWALIPHERDRLYKLLRDTKANGVIVLSGDRHLAELSVSTDAIGYPLYDITSSGFNQATNSWRAPEKNRHRVAAMPFGNNFGFITIDWASETSPRIGLELRDEAGEVAIRHPIRLGLLTAGDQPGKAVVKLPEGMINPAAALKGKVGDEVTVQFEVQAARVTADKKRLFLNSETDFRDEKNFTVVLNAKARDGTYKDATGDTFKGKTVRVKGKLSAYQGKLQIEVDDEKQVEVVK
ncbi:alkaline phosphatase D family protein [Limnoglobus roseus]|uniref:Phosphodiesterase/alkaline phosphatase D n=1 Tax=Limnoglobus roseus TaxID=2598579 RepID=A0A5C1AB46_9BACT|nr:alkaline phosphatase D family protein [Limnoglobus roseus]QEL15447.1 phosphodiesterase/alkaline phosphatase D [Limnoglobus roseus]